MLIPSSLRPIEKSLEVVGPGINKLKKSTRICLDFFFCVHVCSVVYDSLQPNADSSAHGISQARILKRVTMFPLQGNLPTQGLKPHLLHIRRILHH